MQGNLQEILLSFPVLMAILAWTLPWKGIALWRAAKNNHLKWFMVLLIFNTLAILEIVYIFYFSKTRENVPKPNRRN